MRRRKSSIMQITQIAENIRHNIGRMALMSALAAIIVTALAACGSSATGTDSGSGSSPTATTAASSDSSAAPTNTPGNADMMNEDPTQAPASTNNDAATPTQATAAQAGGSGSG